MKQDTPHHPKMKHLARLLGVHRQRAMGLMEDLWHFTRKYCPQGNIGKFSNTHLAQELEWEGDPDELITQLVTAGWLDTCETHRLRVHDWREHCEDWVHWNLTRRRLRFADGEPPDDSKFSQSERTTIQEDYKAGRTRIRGQAHRNFNPQDPPFPDLWEEFWEAWPKNRKQNRVPAIKSWCKHATSEAVAREIIRGVHIHSQPGGALSKNDPTYIPYAVTWLNNKRWEEPYTPTPPKKANTQPPTEEEFREREITDHDLAVGAGIVTDES